MSTVGRRDFAVVIGDGTAYTASAVNDLANGDVALVKRNMTLLVAGETIEDSDEIYVAQGTANGVKFVGPIQGANVIKFNGKAYTATVEQVTHVGNVGSGTNAIVVANSSEYTLHIVFKNFKEIDSERQLRHSLSYTSDASATQEEVADAFVSKINNSEALSPYIVAAKVNNGANYGISITGKAITYDPVTEPTYRKVSFEVFPDDAFGTTPVTYTTKFDNGEGTYAQVRELEYTAQGYDGFTNRRLFPVFTPSSDVVVGTNYDTYIIEHANVHQGGIMEQRTESVSTVFVFIPAGSGQGIQFEALINPYMASTPKSFAPVTL